MGYRALIDREQRFLYPEDAERAQAMPAAAKETYIRTQAAIERGEYDQDGPCCWLDPETQQCRWHDFRPQVCRDFRIGSKDCARIRKQYGKGLATA